MNERIADSPLMFWFLLISSIVATGAIWMRVLRRTENMSYKVLCLLISAVPFFGPVFFIIIDAPPSKLPEEQEDRFSKGTEVHKDFRPLTKSFKDFFL